MTTLLLEARRSPFSVFLIALALIGALILGGAGGYLFKSRQVVASSTTSETRAVDRITGYPSGSVDDLRILAFLKRSGYEGGGTVVAPAVDRITGYPSGSVDDQRILAFLEQSGYEGGGTVVQGGSTPPTPTR
jgi:hypothetical protein